MHGATERQLPTAPVNTHASAETTRPSQQPAVSAVETRQNPLSAQSSQPTTRPTESEPAAINQQPAQSQTNHNANINSTPDGKGQDGKGQDNRSQGSKRVTIALRRAGMAHLS